MKYLFTFIFLLTISISAYAHQIPDGAVPYKKSGKCSSCHPIIYSEWKMSMHAISSAHKDKAHAAVHRKFMGAMKKAGKPENYHCANCHAPMAENLKDLMTGKAKINDKKWQETESIGCAFCHRVESIVEKKKFNSYKINKDGTYYTGSVSGKAPHKTSSSTIFSNGEMCMGCHSHKINSKGAKICVMKEEGLEGNCLLCHMAESNGKPAKKSKRLTHSSHLMMGGHSPSMLKKAVSLDAALKVSGTEGLLKVDLENIMTHTFPSTNPMRMAFVQVEAKDEKGGVVWSNFKETPFNDPKAVLFKAFKAGDKKGVPAWAAEDVAVDTRLKSGEERTLTYTIPSLKDVKSVEVQVIYMLFMEQALTMLEIPRDGINDKKYVVAKKDIVL